jgi:hypothetical protein
MVGRRSRLVAVVSSELVLVLVLEIPNKFDPKIEEEDENEEDAGFSTLRIWATRP